MSGRRLAIVVRHGRRSAPGAMVGRSCRGPPTADRSGSGLSTASTSAVCARKASRVVLGARLLAIASAEFELDAE